MKKKTTTPGRGTADALQSFVLEQAPGTVFTTHDVLVAGLGVSRTALDVTLKRLVDGGQLVRAGRGVFYVPERHPKLGPLPASPRLLAEAWARRRGGQLLPMGPDAAHRLGLTSQVAGRPVFYTTGPGGRRKLGKGTIELRHRNPQLASVAPVVATVVEAVRSLGRVHGISDKVRQQLARALSPADKNALAAGLHVAPEWMRSMLRSVAASTTESGQ